MPKTGNFVSSPIAGTVAPATGSNAASLLNGSSTTGAQREGSQKFIGGPGGANGQQAVGTGYQAQSLGTTQNLKKGK